MKNIENVNARSKPAHPWFEFYGAKSAEELARTTQQALNWEQGGPLPPLSDSTPLT